MESLISTYDSNTTTQHGLGKKFIVLSGTDEHELELHEISNISYTICNSLGLLLRLGGKNNVKTTRYSIRRKE